MMQNARSNLYALTAVAVTAAFMVAGCGGGDQPMETEEAAPEEMAPGVDLCSLLTSNDIEEVLDDIPDDPQPGDEMLGQCTWPSATESGTLVVLTLEEAVLDSFDEFVTQYGVEFGGENPPRDEYHPVEGVPGDWAMYVAPDDMVQAFRGEYVLEVSAPGAEEEQVIDLASRAMERLPADI